MQKRFIIGLFLVCLLSISLVSAFSFSGFWNKITGHAVSEQALLYDFGGMYGYYWNGSANLIYPNPATGKNSCPEGYS